MLASRWNVRRRAVARDEELLGWMRDAPVNGLALGEPDRPAAPETPWQWWHAFWKERVG
jgi:hypothetical protein